MNTVTLSPMHKQLFQLQPQNSHPRVSLRRVLWVRFLRWVDHVKPATLVKLLTSAGTSLLILLTIMAPSFALGLAVSAFRWNGYKIPICLAVFVLTLNAKRIWLWTRRARLKRQSKGNQYLYKGVPIDEFAGWLMEAKAFKLEEAKAKWAFSKNRYFEIAEEMDKAGLLVRGEKNARVLREISYEQLVRQLRDGFPLSWDEISKTWIEKDTSYGQFLRDQSFRTRKLTEDVQKKERRVERLEKKIEEKQEELEESLAGFGNGLSLADVFQYSGQTGGELG